LTQGRRRIAEKVDKRKEKNKEGKKKRKGEKGERLEREKTNPRAKFLVVAEPNFKVLVPRHPCLPLYFKLH